MSWYYYKEYVPVAERRQKMQKKIEKLRKAGEPTQPIEPFRTRTIATSFWGKSWCRHLESFSDYVNRLPRGRSYVRNGSVCHLNIESKTATALVSGSELYQLSIHIEPLDPKKWDTIKSRCKGKIGSLIELLQGRISDEIMTIVTDPEMGLFPSPKEIRFNCNCPDWADMCKHVAAVMYGIGVRLDSQPELLFKLRGVNHEELITVGTAIDDLTVGKRSSRRRTLQTADIQNIFGVSAEEEPAPIAPAPEKPQKKSKTIPAKKFELTGTAIRSLRKKSGLSQVDFAKKLAVSAATVSKWEKTQGLLKLNALSLKKLKALHKQT